MKRFFTVILSLALTVSLCPVFASADNDYATRGEVVEMLLTAADDYNPTVEKSDIIHGDGSGLNEDRFVTRAEALVMLSRAFGELPEPVGNNKRVGYEAGNFTDIPEWALDEIQQVFDAGIVAGTSETTFSPDDNVTKEQMSLFISRVYALYASNPNDDFYAAANKSALDSSDNSPYIGQGSLAEIQETVDAQIDNIVNSVIYSDTTYQIDTQEQQMNDFYKMVIDTDSRNAVGLEPIEDALDAIDAAENMDELGGAFEQIYDDIAVTLLISFSWDIDPDDTDSYLKIFEAQAPFMNAEAYDGSNSEYTETYIAYITELLTISGEDEAEARQNAEAVYSLEKQVFNASDIDLESSATDYNYEIQPLLTYTFDELNALYADFDLTYFFNMTGMSKSGKIYIDDLAVTAATANLWTNSNIDAVKEYAKFLLMNENSFYLTEELENAAGDFYADINGDDNYRSTEWNAREMVISIFAKYINNMYREQYANADYANDVTELTELLISVYKEEIEACSWLSDETKTTAAEKLDNITIKAVCAEPYKSELEQLHITPQNEGGQLFDTIAAIRRIYAQSAVSMPLSVDKSQWYMYNYEVNAGYSPYSNDITIPSGILNAPLYQPTASDEENMAGIGFIIAHELAHAVTGDGLEYNTDGKRVRWMTADEYYSFMNMTLGARELYDGAEAAPGIRVDGELTADENIADLLAIQCVTNAIAKITDNPDYAALYTSFAQNWCEYSTREDLKYTVAYDNHSPAKIRVNTALANTDKFYETFNIKESDGMYTAPEDRVALW
ncbi:MAG: S-layer homology domain-containing protein [Firmicutes bacterium]|nr:S-layer homology domain-containing protein [Bacillota bacterium]